jgi:hypothetical protein
MDSSSDLLATAAVLVATSALPRNPNITTVGSTSIGEAVCCICREAIEPGTQQIELAPDPPAAYASIYAMHPACHQAWLDIISLEDPTANAEAR